MAEWYTSDHVEQGKGDYAVSSGSSIKVSFGKGKSTNKNLHGGFGEMRLRRFIYWHGEFRRKEQDGKWRYQVQSFPALGLILEYRAEEDGIYEYD